MRRELDPGRDGRRFGSRPRCSTTAIRCSSSYSCAWWIASAARSAASRSSDCSAALNGRPARTWSANVADAEPLDLHRCLDPFAGSGRPPLSSRLEDAAHLPRGRTASAGRPLRRRGPRRGVGSEQLGRSAPRARPASGSSDSELERVGQRLQRGRAARPSPRPACGPIARASAPRAPARPAGARSGRPTEPAAGAPPARSARSRSRPARPTSLRRSLDRSRTSTPPAVWRGGARLAASRSRAAPRRALSRSSG